MVVSRQNSSSYLNSMPKPSNRLAELGLVVALAVLCPTVLLSQEALPDDEMRHVEFFESHVRPALIEYCLDCHASETEASGGLVLDSRAGWLAGGDSGAAIQPGEADQSRLLLAIEYEDSGLQMPPEGKLPEKVIEAFRKWIDDGAIDPRQAPSIETRPKQVGLPVERAQEHWAYRPLTPVTPAEDAGLGSSSAIDHFINVRLEEAGIPIAPPANRAVQIRRLYFDLTGLAPSREEVEAFVSSPDPNAYAHTVDRLLASPRYGEHIARQWMDVARYAESITLRGFVLPNAWRYRDYLVAAFSEDRPFDQMIREQIAGDLLEHQDVRERSMQLIATTFLAMGNTNLEQQDKTQLEMDYIDEQLEVVGRAFLAQTIGCARCHDHKFDPIPTSDYYAMAGIFRSAVALEHANVSKWIDKPLPLPSDKQTHYDALAGQLKELETQSADIKKQLSQIAKLDNRLIPLEELAGVVIDNSQAKLVGAWVTSTHTGRFVHDGYIHDENKAKGQKTATFEPQNLAPGEYEVRLAYSSGSNRASNTRVQVFSADGDSTILVDQRKAPPEDGLWISLGTFRFEQDGQAYVLISNDMTDGHVIADAVQFLRRDDQPKTELATERKSPAADATSLLKSELEQLTKKQKQIQAQLDRRPHYLTVVEQRAPADIAIHIRGDVHNLGDVVPRGFLTAIRTPSKPKLTEKSSGRLELAYWMSSDDNPLAARVYANRVWSWLMGQGLVSSINNFGTTGTQPSHPQLLNWLATELIQSGWSTKHLVRTIVSTDAYRRRMIAAPAAASKLDPANRLFWRGHSRRLTAEALRDCMLQVSGELDFTMGGSLIPPGTKADYSFAHQSTRRSIYHPVLRNSLPELFEVFDFADTSVSVGRRARSTVAPQALLLLNHPWVTARARAAASRLRSEVGSQSLAKLVNVAYRECLGRAPTEVELAACQAFLDSQGHESLSDPGRFEQLIHSLLASLDFRYLE